MKDYFIFMWVLSGALMSFIFFFLNMFSNLFLEIPNATTKTAVTQTICCERGKHTSVSDDSRCCFTHVMNRELPAALVCCDWKKWTLTFCCIYMLACFLKSSIHTRRKNILCLLVLCVKLFIIIFIEPILKWYWGTVICSNDLFIVLFYNRFKCMWVWQTLTIK